MSEASDTHRLLAASLSRHKELVLEASTATLAGNGARASDCLCELKELHAAIESSILSQIKRMKATT